MTGHTVPAARTMAIVGLMAGAALLAGAPAPAAPAAGAEKLLTPALIYGGALDGLPPSDFQWSPGGDRFTFTRRPAPDATPLLYVYDVAKRRATALTSAADGPGRIAVSAARWNPAGDAILVVSGGDLYLIAVPRGGAPGEPRRLTKTEAEEKDPKFSPDGALIGFLRDGDLHVIDLAGGKERDVTRGGGKDLVNGGADWVYGEELDLSSAWWWSPDSTRIAYLQFDERLVPTYPIVDWLPTHPATTLQRYPKAGDPNPIVRLGVATIDGGADGRTQWMDLGGGADLYVPRVAWAPSGRSLAALRLDRSQTHLDLLSCDPGGGACRTLLQESDPMWVNVGDDWKMLENGFVWGSERDGYRHLYLYDDEGRLVRRLTSGSWVVTDLLGVDPKEGWVYFAATEKSPMERHLYRVRLDGSGFERLTREEGWHIVELGVVQGGGARWVDERSTAMTPEVFEVRDADGSLIDTLDPGMGAEVAAYRRGRVEFLTVPAADGARLPASITRPPDFDPARRYPVLVYVYGGPHAQLVANRWRGTLSLWHLMMAERGVIVWQMDNRGMGGRGHAWETPIHHDMGRHELADQLDGVAYLRSLPWVDPSRIGIWGWSYGGYMTLYALLNAPDVFAAGVAVAPVTDWRNYDTIYTERYMGLPADNGKGYEDSAPLRKASALKAPLLLVHGSSDDNVHMQNSAQILDAFVNAGRPVDFMMYPRKNHSILGKETRTHLFVKITDFLFEHLVKGGTAP